MKITDEIEDLILKINIATDLNILLIDNKQIVYFIGETDFCAKYLYEHISNELKDIQKDIKEIKFFKDLDTLKIIANDRVKYKCQAIGKLKNENQYIMFYKLDDDFTEKEKKIIESTYLLLNKYVN